jgi:hypothetical protein
MGAHRGLRCQDVHHRRRARELLDAVTRRNTVSVHGDAVAHANDVLDDRWGLLRSDDGSTLSSVSGKRACSN